MLSRIYWIEGFNLQRLGTMARPRGGEWLEDEVKGWRTQGIQVVASSLTDAEMSELSLTDEPTLCYGYGIKFRRYPVEDRGVPSSIKDWNRFVSDLIVSTEPGAALVSHCRMGIGRASMIAISVMVQQKVPFLDALAMTTAARGCEIPDTEEQKAWLLEYSRSIP